MPEERFAGARDLMWKALRGRVDALVGRRLAEAGFVPAHEHRAEVELLHRRIEELRSDQARLAERFESVRTDVRAIVERAEWERSADRVDVS